VVQVDFHIIQKNAANKDLYIAKLIEKAYQQLHEVFVYTLSAQESINMDHFLWSYEDVSFLPHQMGSSKDTPIIIHHEMIAGHGKVLINFNPDIPDCYQQFLHIIEIIEDSENAKKIGRDKYKCYQQSGCLLSSYFYPEKPRKA
jgi:DNA polymerase III subunit chi